MKNFRCKYCGREIQINTPCVQLVNGEIVRDEEGIELFEQNDKNDVVYYHETCYLSMTNDPSLVDKLW